MSLPSCVLKTESGYSGRGRPERGTEHEEDEERDIILEQVARLLVPFILMFGVYVVLNGHLSPEAGSPGGTVMGAGLILYANAFWAPADSPFFSFKNLYCDEQQRADGIRPFQKAIPFYGGQPPGVGYSFGKAGKHLQRRPDTASGYLCGSGGGRDHSIALFPVPGRGGVIMQALVTNYYETAAMILFSIGFTMLLLQKNLIKKGHRAEHYRICPCICSWRPRGHIAGGRAPIADGRTSVEGFINPLPSGLVLTGESWCLSACQPSLFTDSEIPPLLQDTGFGRHAV